MAKKTTDKKAAFFDLGDDWKVTNVRENDWGIFFTLSQPGLQLFNLRIVPAGRKYDAFIGMPEEKGKDGKYYKEYALYLSADDTKAVIDAVMDALDAE